MSPRRLWSPTIVFAILRRPALWPEALAAVHRMVGKRGASVAKLIPDDYLRFRVQTAVGGDAAAISANDVIDWLKWARRFRTVVE